MPEKRRDDVAPYAFFRKQENGKYKGYVIAWVDPHDHELPSDANECASDAAREMTHLKAGSE